MKRSFLQSLGIEDKDLIDKILDENSADIGRAKGELETYKSKVTELEGKLGEKDTEISALKGQVGDTATLNQKITQLETDKATLTTELNTKVSQLQKDYAVEGRIREAKGRNVKAIKALLDESKITYDEGVLGGIDEQLEALAKAEDSAMLFGDAQVPPPSGTHLNNPPSNGGKNPPTATTLAEAVAKALTKN